MFFLLFLPLQIIIEGRFYLCTKEQVFAGNLIASRERNHGHQTLGNLEII